MCKTSRRRAKKGKVFEDSTKEVVFKIHFNSEKMNRKIPANVTDDLKIRYHSRKSS
jgi:RNA polymerase-interacting CarD/CdnL/TRCF family regulator